MTDNPHQRALEREAAQQDFLDLHSDRSAFWEAEARRYAAIADGLLLQWRDLASRVPKSMLKAPTVSYDQDGD